MAILKTPGNYPKRIGNFVIYVCRGQTIIRSISGFTTKDLKKSAKYKKCRENANEFGRLSALCKTIRVALQPILPKNNNLALVNSFTKKMREVMTCDTVSAKGMRTLKMGLTTSEGKVLLENYHFNPEIKYALPVTVTTTVDLNTEAIKFPAYSQYIGACLHILTLDWETNTHKLTTGEKRVYKKDQVPATIPLPLPEEIVSNETVFTILELEFYKMVKGSFVPMKNDSSKVVMVVGVE